ncbi:MAG: ribosomal RNA small subunit methyltransferase A [Promethearchaeota archaeon]|nr:MAG: ribosomal RNA small subunit methyltransferase A [Candidatus Lokiarchaeota archaeon]
MNDMNKSEVLLILKQLGIRPNKELGQNFLINKNTVSKIILESSIKTTQSILEIGPGLGALTEDLVKKSDQIYAYEIDSVLFSYLSNKFSNYENLKLYNEDILKAKIPSHDMIISNIPYSITGPIFEKIFYNPQPPCGVLIIENSIAERLFNRKSYKSFSRITVTFNAFMKPVRKFKISRFDFFPTPKIELALVVVEPRKVIDQMLLSDDGRTFFLKFVAGIMPYKNKNMVNAIKYFLKNDKNFNYSKQHIEVFLRENQLKNSKVALFSVDEIVELSKKFYSFLNN